MLDEACPDHDLRCACWASAFLTPDCKIPNCLAIADGLTPALNAARTAFSFPVVNDPAPSLADGRRGRDFALDAGLSIAGLGSRRPRRSASVVTAASSASISASSSRFSAPARSFGRKWRGCGIGSSALALTCGAAGSLGAVVGTENRSGVIPADRRVDIPPIMPPASHRGNGLPSLCRCTFPGDHFAEALPIVFVRLVEEPDVALVAGTAPVVVGAVLPAVQDWFVLALVI